MISLGPVCLENAFTGKELNILTPAAVAKVFLINFLRDLFELIIQDFFKLSNETNAVNGKSDNNNYLF